MSKTRRVFLLALAVFVVAFSVLSVLPDGDRAAFSGSRRETRGLKLLQYRTVAPVVICRPERSAATLAGCVCEDALPPVVSARVGAPFALPAHGSYISELKVNNPSLAPPSAAV